MFGKTFGHDLEDFADLPKTEQFQKLRQDGGTQSPEVGLIIVLHVHEVTDIRILRVVVYLCFEGQVTSWPQVVERCLQGEYRIWQVVESAEVQDDIKLTRATKGLRVADEEFRINLREGRKETRGVNVSC